MRVWSYVISTDRGSAPNYDDPAVTLAICKPRIREKAQPGDLVLAFNGRKLAPKPHSIRWAGIVSEVLSLGDYWDDSRFHTKRPDRSDTPDNIYKWVDGHLSQVPNTSHDKCNIKTDIGGVNALIFSQAWHMGADGPELPEEFNLRVVANRRSEPLREMLPEQWIKLEDWLKKHDRGLPKPGKGLKSGPCAASQSKLAKC